LGWLNAGWRLRDSDVGEGDITWANLSLNEAVPSFSSLTDNIHGVLLVLALTGEGELVLWLSIWDLVDTEPLVGGTEETWKVALNILNV
jgi:hypothetical protein